MQHVINQSLLACSSVNKIAAKVELLNAVSAIK